jgi:hypothetical protein
MKVLTIDSLAKISSHLAGNPNDLRLITHFTAMSEELGLKFVDGSYDLDLEKVQLKSPSKDIDEKTTDVVNSIVVYEAFKNLSPAQATDARLWITLCFMHFNDYVRKRWHKDDEKEMVTSIKNHWTFGGDRPQFRDNALSRLWWTGFIATRIPGWSAEDVTEILYDNSDYFSQVILRPSSSTNAAVLHGILSITKEAYIAGGKYERAKFINFMKKVNFLAGRTNLAVLAQGEIIELLKPEYIDAHEPPPVASFVRNWVKKIKAG